jgi:hypothetical protein
MSLLTKGITRLSQLEIDADKDWRGKGITNIKEVASAMSHGDMIVRSDSTPVLVKLPCEYGIGYHFIHAKSVGGGKFEPEWKDIQELVAYLNGGVNRMIAPPILTVPTPITGFETIEDHSGGGYIAEKTWNVPTPSIGPPATATYSPGAVDGAIADDGGVQTVETTEANSAAVGDMTLLPAVPAVNDAYYFGLSAVWDWLSLNIGTTGVGTWTVVWEYWNGAAWASLPRAKDTSNGFRNGGYQSVTFERPVDWATSTILLLNLYWVRARVSAYTSITTQPLGTQGWIGIH